MDLNPVAGVRELVRDEATQLSHYYAAWFCLHMYFVWERGFPF